MSFEYLMQNVRRAATGGINSMSTGEALAAALVLNRSDWLADMGYSIAEALDRIDEPWVGMLRRAEKAWRQEAAAHAQVEQIAKDAAVAASIFGAATSQENPEPLDLSAKLVTYSDAPGYRDVGLVFDVSLIGEGKPRGIHRIAFRVDAKDGESILEQILQVHRFAWRNGKPLDMQANETPPRWVAGKI